MFIKIIDGLIDRMLTADFWRGIVYILSALGVAITPDNAAVIVSTALAVSGVIHTIWHKQTDTIDVTIKK